MLVTMLQSQQQSQAVLPRQMPVAQQSATPFHVTQSMEMLHVLRAEQMQISDPAERARRAGDIARFEFKLSQAGYYV